MRVLVFHISCQLLLAVYMLMACTKNDTGQKTATTCERTVAALAGRYHLTKFESVSYRTGAAQDVSFYLTPCELAGIYTFRSDSTASYTEQTPCTNQGSGNWSASATGFSTFYSSGSGNRLSGISFSITSWDCTHLVLLTSFPSVDSNYRYTLTRF